MKAQELTAQQRAQYFAMQTRQNLQMLAKQSTVSVPSTLQFQLPKARLLAGLFVSVKATFPSLSEDNGELEKLIRRISLDLNNGFSPFVVSGAECKLYNMIDLNADNIISKWQTKVEENTAIINFHLQTTTNSRDPIGLILLQNDQTNVTLNIDMGMGSECGLGDDPTKVEVKVMTETFSIPKNDMAFPDLSVLKLVTGRKDSLPTAGQQVIHLSTGTIYRKIIFKLTDASGNPMKLEDITSNIELVFNQADINYSVDPEMLRIYNEKQLGYELPEGVYMFDFSNSGGQPNIGGTRDYIDSANLTEMWLRFTTGKTGKCEIVTETLSRLG